MRCATFKGLSSQGEVFDLVCRLVDELLPDIPVAEKERILKLRGLVKPSLIPPELDADVVEDLVGKDEAKEVQAQSGYLANNSNRVSKCCG